MRLQANDHVLQIFEVFFLRQNKFLSVCQPVKKNSNKAKADKFLLRNVDLCNIMFHRKSIAISKKNVDLRLEFALFVTELAFFLSLVFSRIWTERPEKLQIRTLFTQCQRWMHPQSTHFNIKAWKSKFPWQIWS